MNNQIDEIYLDALLSIWIDGPSSRVGGICDVVRRYCLSATGRSAPMYEKLAAAFKSWPMRSGDSVFPVPHPEMDPEYAYLNSRDLWIDEYGFNRYQLLNHLIKVEMGWL